MSRPAPIHICFYSSRCQWSKAFLEEISKTNYHSEFRFICVDPSPNRPPLPSWLKQTPTLVISGNPQPLTDSEVMNWLYERKMKDGAGNKGGNGGNYAANAGPMEPEAYVDMEMGGGYSDSYALLDDNMTAEGDGGTRMRHNFTYLNGQDAVSAHELSNNYPSPAATAKVSKKHEMMEQRLEAFKSNRDRDLPKGPMRQ